MGSTLSLSTSGRSYKRKSRGGLYRKPSFDASRIPMASLTTISERQRQHLKRHLKESFKSSTCSPTSPHTSRILLDLDQHPLDLDDPNVLAMLVKYFAKYTTTSEIELEVFASSSRGGSSDIDCPMESTDDIDIFEGMLGPDTDEAQEIHLSVDGLVTLLTHSAVLRNNLTSLYIGHGCALKGNLPMLFYDTLPSLPRLRHLHLENLRVSASIASLIFSSWRRNSALEVVSLHSLHGDFEELFCAMATNQSNLAHLKQLQLHNLYICRAAAVVEAAANYLGCTAITQTLQKLYLSFADEFECNLDSLARGLMKNAHQSQLNLLSVRHVTGRHFPISSFQELDSFLKCAKDCPSLKQLRLDVASAPALIVSPIASPPNDPIALAPSLAPRQDITSGTDKNRKDLHEDEAARKAIAQQKVDELKFQLRLNRYKLGLQLLDRKIKTSTPKWTKAVIEAKNDTGVVFHYLSHDPSWIIAATKC